jgi:hypothetical protein
MIETLTRYQKPFSCLFTLLSAIYFIVSFVFFINQPAGGDEIGFIADLEFVLREGLIAGIERRISIPYTLLAYPIAIFSNALFALRAVNVVLLILLLLYFYRIAGIRNRPFYAGVMFYVATGHLFCVGVNDPLFIVALVIFFTETYFFLENGKMNNPALALTGLVIAVFTRELILVYIPVIVLSFLLLYRKGFRPSLRSLVVPGSFLALFLMLNIPSFTANHKLSYDNKVPAEGVTWAQRQYLAQLWVNEGKIPNFSHPSWEETRAYLDEHGKDSLPEGVLNGLTHDPKLTIIEFFKDLYYSLFFGFRQLGLMLIFPLYYFASEIIRRRWTYSLYIPAVMALITGIFSLIIISFVELRWYEAAYFPGIVFFYCHSEKIRNGQTLRLANDVILIFLSLYGIYRIVARI